MKRFIAIALLALCGRAAATPPSIRSHFPSAGQIGAETRLQIIGKDLGSDAHLVLPFAADVKLTSSSAEQATFLMKPAKDTVPGVYPVRARTSGGLSNLVLFAITDLPVLREVEPNGRIEQAQPITWPCVIAGSIGGQGAPHPSKDMDLYRFHARAGQRLTFVAETRRLGLAPDLFLRLRQANGRSLAECDDAPGLGVDPRLDYTFAEAGEYILEVHLTDFNYSGRTLGYLVKIGDLDYARSVFPLGGRRGEKLRLSIIGRDERIKPLEMKVPQDPSADRWHQRLPEHPGSLAWRLAIGDLPETTEHDAPAPQRVDWPITINGRIARPDEVDRFRISVKPGDHIRARVAAHSHGSALQAVVRAHDPAGKQLGESGPKQPRMEIDPRLDLVVPENVHELTLTLADLFGRGGIEYPYRLTIERGEPNFDLLLGAEFPRDNHAQNDVLHLPLDVPISLPVRVLRRGYEGPITLCAIDAPPGLVVKPGVIAEGKKNGEITFTLTKPMTQPFELTLMGEAEHEGHRLRRPSITPLHLAEPYFTNLAPNWRLDRLLCCPLPGRSTQ